MWDMETERGGLEWSEVKRHHFFKVLIGDFKSSLRIPPKFVTNITTENEGKASYSNVIPTKTAMLEGPTGRIWHVKIEKRGNNTYFTNGWDKFAQDHILKEHEFLVFRYNGNLHFYVLMFDTSACEKEDSFLKEKVSETPDCREESENRERETDVSASRQEKTKLNEGCEMPVCSEKKNKEKNKIDTDCEIISNCEKERERKDKEKEVEVEEIDFEEIRKFVNDCKNLATKKRARDFELASFDRRKKFAKTEKFCDLSKEINEEFVDEFGNSSPDSNITTTINKEVLVIEKERESEEGLRREDREKEVEDPSYEKIRKFAKDCENLATKKRSKDVELKLFLEGKKKFFKIETFVDLTKEIKEECVNEFGNSSPDSNITTSKEGNNRKNTSHPKEKTSKIDDEVQEITINEMPFHARCTTRNSYGRVKIEENLQALDSAMSFQSKFPSFVWHMTKYNAERCNCVRFPTKFSRNYLPRKQTNFILRNSFEKEWDVGYVSCNGEKAMLSKGWPSFKRANLLKEDDCCVFELVKPTEFLVHIFRA
ncbi:hypothetical protein LUZ60_000449 [Juncus effusus]|nr:hypothetical protein LUZ60_000449 [Juncus effusus]